ncbi:MAG: hypothetical protein KDJ36_02360 [Hyphomicrobiaceae bacterium]|nr:hypothetical protein [Hyphomicrobiaceae bacterium]
MVRNFLAIACVVSQSVMLTGCDGALSSSAVRQVLSRTTAVLERFDRYMHQYDYKSLSPTMSRQLEHWLNQELNKTPRITGKRILTRMKSDASIDGFGDENGNGRIDPADKRLFKIEIDTYNNRIIATAEGGSTYGTRPRTSGFMTGFFVASLMNRQRAAGVTQSHFANRSVYRTSSSSSRGYRSARGRARSGGVFRGK